jgi:CheY-like chemotaxis protein
MSIIKDIAALRGINMETRKRIGNILVESGIITGKTLERTLILQKRSRKRLGVLLRGMGIVTEDEVVEALAKQNNLKIIRNFADRSFPKELLDLIPAQIAMEKLIFPLKHHERMLAIATFDPLDRETFDRLAQLTGLNICPVLASREEIIASVRKNYTKEENEISRSQKILLIDDSPIFTQVIETAFRKENYDVLVAGDGVEGLKMAVSNHPDLILCDLLMPQMNGYEFIRVLRAHYDIADIPVILMTTKASVEEEDRALKAGFIDFISKPVQPVRLVAQTKKVLSIVENLRQTVGGSQVNVDIEPDVFSTKATNRSNYNRRDVTNRDDSIILRAIRK